MICPYKIDIPENGALDLFTTNDGRIVAYDDEYDYYIAYNTGEIIEYVEAHPSTRNELKQAGLWNIVINKEVFSSVEEELDEYLRIGEELEKRKDMKK